MHAPTILGAIITMMALSQAAPAQKRSNVSEALSPLLPVATKLVTTTLLENTANKCNAACSESSISDACTDCILEIVSDMFPPTMEAVKGLTALEKRQLLNICLKDPEFCLLTPEDPVAADIFHGPEVRASS